MSRLKSASALAVLAALGGCEVRRNLGKSPVGEGLYFPAAMTLDPRIDPDAPARWLFVANANSNLEYNGGSLVAVDLDRFFDSWMNCAEQCLLGQGLAVCQARYEAEHRQEFADQKLSEAEIAARVAEGTARIAADPCGNNEFVGDAGSELDVRHPCRHVTFKPQVVECEDNFVLAGTCSDGVCDDEDGGVFEPLSARMGSFITSLEGWKDPDSGRGLLLAAVKADPSITWIELAGGIDDPNTDMVVEGKYDPSQRGRLTTSSLDVDCGQGDPDLDDPGRCSRRTHALRYRYDNTGNVRIGPEPSNIMVSKTQPWAFVTFATTPELVLIDLKYPYRNTTKPVIVDQANMFVVNTSISGSGWGLAERPCEPGSDEVPALSQTFPEGTTEPVDCGRPVVYGGFRNFLSLARIFADIVEPIGGQGCIPTDGTLDQGLINCDPQLFLDGTAPTGGFDNGSGAGSLGDIAFSRDGRRLFAVQSSPGALLYVDTSVDDRGELRDDPAGVVELCSSPTTMTVFEDAANEYAAVTCPTANELFVVDLSGFRVVANVTTGMGPHPIVFDRARRLLYVGNTLDRTVSVIDVATDRATRFAEIARVGQQVPYKR